MKDLKDEAKFILLNSLKKVDIQSLIKERVKVHDEKLIFGEDEICSADFDEVLLIGFGKAALPMGYALETLLGDKIKRGILVTNRLDHKLYKSEIIVAGHPTPNENSLLAARKIISALQASNEKTLVIFLISGGGSSLVELPLQGITLEDLQQLNQVLVGSGATIHEINIIRKRLSQLKGGKLGQLARGVKCLALYLSDVNQGDLSALASGPLFIDESTSEQFISIVERYQLLAKVPPSVASIIKEEMLPKPDNSEGIERLDIAHLLLLENADLLKIAARVAEGLGLRAEICKDFVEGRYQVVAEELLQRLIVLHKQFPDETVCLLSGGEVECPVHANGIGGRNQEFVLYSATRFSSLSNKLEVAVLSCGTDGVDGISCAGGAVISNLDFYTGKELRLNASSFIDQNDSHSFLKQSGGLLVVGPTGNNVRDLRILLARSKTITKESQND